MKTYKNLFEQICDFENIYLAYRKARKGKRGRMQAAMFERIQDDELLALQEELQTRAYKPGAYHSFFIHDPKKRLISAAPFWDRVVHHALCRVKGCVAPNGWMNLVKRITLRGDESH